MSRISVLAASEMEAAPVATLMGVPRLKSSTRLGPLEVGPNEITLFVTGMGPKRAAESAAKTLANDAPSESSDQSRRQKPDAVIVVGFCGGLTDSLPETTIVTYSGCLSTVNGGIPCFCTPELSAQITSLLNAQHVACESVMGITSPRIAITKDDKLRLARAGAQVVDMESYEILSAARRVGIPATVLRVVSDSLDRELPDFNRALNPDGSVSGGKALRVLLGSPVMTATAYAANKRALRYLASALKIVLSSDFPKFR